jgi:hypothetical protein
MNQLFGITLAGLMLVAQPFSANAVENAFGRTLPGVWIMPGIGIVGPTPGLSVSVFPIGFMGSISGNRVVPIAGTLVTNVDAGVSETLIVPRYVYKTESKKITVASTFDLPLNWLEVTGSVQVQDKFFGRTDVNGGVGDVFFSPVTIGIHFSETNHLAIDAKVFAPTASYTFGSLANLGMNVWTVQPNIGHTFIWQKHGLEFDNYVGFDIYQHNPVTNYTSGTVFHWDGMVMKHVGQRFAAGAILSNITQINNDSGPLATILKGFEARAWGAGPIALWVARPKDPAIALQLRWVREFAVQNLLGGDTLLFGITISR